MRRDSDVILVRNRGHRPVRDWRDASGAHHTGRHGAGLGDEIQAMKAGITEVADLHVVNKEDADPAGAEGRCHGVAASPERRHPCGGLVGRDERGDGGFAGEMADTGASGLGAYRRRCRGAASTHQGAPRVPGKHGRSCPLAAPACDLERYHQAVAAELRAHLSREWRDRLEFDEAAVAEGRLTPRRAAQTLVREVLSAPPHGSSEGNRS